MPLFRRRPLLRAAAVGGGAYAIGKHAQRGEEERQEQAYSAGSAVGDGRRAAASGRAGAARRSHVR